MSSNSKKYMQDYLKENKTFETRDSIKQERQTLHKKTSQHSLNNPSEISSRLLERQILELEQEIMNLESLKNSNFALEEEISLLMGDLEQTRQLGHQKKDRLEKEINLNSLEWEKRDLKLKVAGNNVEELEEKIEACCENFEKKEDECQEEEEKIEEMESRVAELEEETKEMKEDVFQLKQDIKAKIQKKTDLKDQIFETENEFKLVVKQKGELQRAILEIENTIKRVDKEDFEYETVLVRKTQKESDLETESEYLLKELEMYRDERDRLELDVNNLSLSLKHLREGGQQMDKIKGDNQMMLDSLREEKIRLITEVEMKRNEIRNEKEEIEKIEEELRRMNIEGEDLSRRRLDCEGEQQDLEKELKRQREINARVKHLIEGQKYLEGFLQKSIMKNKSMLHQL